MEMTYRAVEAMASQLMEIVGYNDVAMELLNYAEAEEAVAVLQSEAARLGVDLPAELQLDPDEIRIERPIVA